MPTPPCSGPCSAYVLWGQLQPDVPSTLQGINDKLLHFAAYFVLGAMAGGAVRRPGAVKWVVLGLIVVGAAIEIVQGYVGRETSVLDGVANGTGAIAGALLARFVLDPLAPAMGIRDRHATGLTAVSALRGRTRGL